jgi:hypothetical protein
MYNSYGTFYHNGYSELYHHGVKGQSWGKRRYQNPDGSLTPEGYIHYGYAKKETRAFNRRHKNHGVTVDEAYEIDAKRLDKRNKYIAKNLQKEVNRYSKGKRAKSPEGLGNDYDNWNKTVHDPKVIGGMIIQQILAGGVIGNTAAIAVRNAKSRENLIKTGKYYLNKIDYDSMKKSGNLEKIRNENFDAATDIARFNRQILDRNKGKNTGISIKNPKYVASEENIQRLKKEAEKKNLKHSDPITY